jgi:hypothetical protein
MKKLHPVFKIVVYIFASIGFILVTMYIAVELGLTKTRGIVDTQRDHFQEQLKTGTTSPAEAWNSGEEWEVLREAVLKDKEVIDRAATAAGVEPRLIVSLLAVEQLRLFHSNRELFKTAFAPLKILAIQSQFSWGVMGVKQDTAIEIETHLKDPVSPWYLGKDFENTLDFSTADAGPERFERLTNEDDRYYSYLYAGLLLHQLQAQWQKAGFPITDRPDILATLYDLGFEKSTPHANPLSGGAEIEIGETSYSFGMLAKKFYESGELVEEFPR